MKHVFPKWFYHKDFFRDGKIIRSQAEFDGMPEGFVESYGDLDKPTEMPEEISQEEAEKQEEAEIGEIVEPVQEVIEDLKEKAKKARTRKGK